MKVETALTLWCPATPRPIYDPVTSTTNHTGTRCIGPACMKWKMHTMKQNHPSPPEHAYVHVSYDPDPNNGECDL
jgi:hypothetical protein